MKKNIIISPLGVYLFVRIFLITVVGAFQAGFNEGSNDALKALGYSVDSQKVIETLKFFKIYKADTIFLPIATLVSIGLALYYRKK